MSPPAGPLASLLPRLLELPLAPPSLTLEERGRQRRRAEFGDFAGYAPYTPGDDLRLLDWNVLARSGHAVLKRFDGVEHRRLVLALDSSASMAERWDGVLRLAEVLVWLGLHRLDSVDLVVCDGAGGRSLRFAGPASFERARAELASLRPEGDSGFAALGARLVERGREGRPLLVSDFVPEERALGELERLAAARHRLLCLRPRSAAEAGRGVPGTRVRLVELETGRALALTKSPALLRLYAEEQRAFEARLGLRCRELGHRLRAADLPAEADWARVGAWLPFLDPMPRAR